MIKKISICFFTLFWIFLYDSSFAMDSSEEDFLNSSGSIHFLSQGDSDKEGSLSAPATEGSPGQLKRPRPVREESPSEGSSSPDEDDSESEEPSRRSVDKDFEPSSSDEESCEPPPKRSKRNTTQKASPKPRPSLVLAPKKNEGSDEDSEISLQPSLPSYSQSSTFPHFIVPMGMRLKFLANIYLGNVDTLANIFLPQYTLEFENFDGSTQKVEDWFKTSKGKICVFASGGLHHVWEKNVGHVNQIFFEQNVKLIRAHWIQKHLSKEKRIARDLEKEFSGKENELHSEFYYDIFLREFFIPSLPDLLQQTPGTLKSVKIHAFSWWDVCTGCEKTLSRHEELFSDWNVRLSYEIASRRRYAHKYPDASPIKAYAIPPTVDDLAWNVIWRSITDYTGKRFQSEKEKEIFWTTTQEGLEVCKWLGQAFRETTIDLTGRAKEGGEGDIITFYKKMQLQETEALEELLSYLKDKNWDLSCWYRGPFPHNIQIKWKKEWKQLIMPHFNWEFVHDYPVEDEDNDHCEMCGNTNLKTKYVVFHPKYHVSGKVLSFSNEEKEMTECTLGYNRKTPFASLPAPLQNKRKQALSVGSECVQVLELSKEDINGFIEKGEKATEGKTQEQAERLAAGDLLIAEERRLRNQKTKKK